MSKQEYEDLLGEFRKLAVRVGSRQFDLRWHNLSGVVIRYNIDARGEWQDVEWPGLAANDWPFDPKKRWVAGQVCLPIDEAKQSFTSELDPVTIPLEGAAADVVTPQHLAIVASGHRGFVGPVYLAGKFRALSARAGIALSPELRDWLARYYPEHNKAPANWWYALLFAMSGQTVGRRVGESLVPKRELIIDRPLEASIDAIQRCRLNTDEPRLPDGVATFPPAKPVETVGNGLVSNAKATPVTEPKKPWKPSKDTKRVIDLMNQGLSNEVINERRDVKVKNTAENIRTIRSRARKAGLLRPPE